uniref:Uncharacterized protein n=1 Tax=Aegilops tauschii subsp. strangulata TaxID=200361 RepID=A0A453TB60_AEGTS
MLEDGYPLRIRNAQQSITNQCVSHPYQISEAKGAQLKIDCYTNFSDRWHSQWTHCFCDVYWSLSAEGISACRSSLNLPYTQETFLISGDMLLHRYI